MFNHIISNSSLGCLEHQLYSIWYIFLKNFNLQFVYIKKPCNQNFKLDGQKLRENKKVKCQVATLTVLQKERKMKGISTLILTSWHSIFKFFDEFHSQFGCWIPFQRILNEEAWNFQLYLVGNWNMKIFYVRRFYKNNCIPFRKHL